MSESAPAADSGRIAIPIVFIGAEETPIIYVNHVIAQFERDEFIVTVGQFAPPILIGTPEERREQLRLVSNVPVRVVARLAFNRDRIRQLIGVLEENVKQYDKAHQKEA